MNEIHELLAELADVLPPVGDFNERSQQAYVRELADIPIDLLQQAVRDIIRTARYFPRISEIRERAAQIVSGVPSPVEALEQIEARIRWVSSDHGEAARPAVHPVVLATLGHLGGFVAFREADNPAAFRGQFLRLYRDESENVVLQMQRGNIGVAAIGSASLRELAS